MADADWHRYRQLRGRDLPDTAELLGATYHRRKTLKRDFYAAVGVYERAASGTPPALVLLKVYHTEPLWGLPLGWLGRWLCRREVRYYELLCGIAGVPQLLGRHGESGLVREFVPGCDLRQFRKAARPDECFFGELARILADVHARGMSHNDLSKPENVVVRADGRPVLIDFQIAFAPRSARWPVMGVLSRVLLRFMQKVDRYHLRKLHRRARPEDFTDEERANARRKNPVIWLHGILLRRPYRAVRHVVLDRWMRVDEKKRAA
jgi:predicted Ser/Thr protein kinase